MELGDRADVKTESLDSLLERVQPKLRRLIARHGVPAQDVDDILQQTLLSLVHKRDSIRNVETWLVGTVRNQCLMYFRTTRRRLYQTVDTAVLELMAEPQQPPQAKKELAHDLAAAISQIPSRCRSLLRLRYRLGYEPAEVAEQMGYQPSSIRKITSRCLAVLVRQLVSAGYREESDQCLTPTSD